MLPRNQRMQGKMFSLLEEAKVFKNKVFLLKFISGDDLGSCFCFSVSKQISKKAVVRNRMRRAGYRLLEKYIPKIEPNVLALFSFRTNVQNDEDIDKNLESILRESKLIN